MIENVAVFEAEVAEGSDISSEVGVFDSFVIIACWERWEVVAKAVLWWPKEVIDREGKDKNIVKLKKLKVLKN